MQQDLSQGTGPLQPVNDATIVNIENDYPNERAVLSANTFFADRFNVMVRAIYYGEHLDQAGVIGVNKATVDSIVYLDLDLGFQLNDNWRFNLGAINIFDEFINEDPFGNGLSSGLQYPRRAAASYEGGQFYLRGTFSF